MTSPETSPETSPSSEAAPETTPVVGAEASPAVGAAVRPVPTPPRRPGPVPRPPRPTAPAPAATNPGTTSTTPEPDVTSSPWGRVADDGTVFVRTPDGERAVGSMPDASPSQALAFFTKRFEDLVFEVELLERRVRGGAMNPEEATESVTTVATSVHGAQAVGDLTGLEARLTALRSTIDKQRDRRRKERARRQEQARVEKERIVADSEKLASSDDWRAGANRMRDLLEEWKVLARLEKSADDALWRRFSTARTTYTRRRKAHFAELHEQRDGARVIKQRLVTEAEAIAGTTDWGAGASRYRDLMRQWKTAGAAPKGVDDQLWKRFRDAQDTFFGARDAASAEADKELVGNAEVKETLLIEAEALLPVRDLRTAKAAFRGIADRWDAAGQVPKDRMKTLEGRMRRVEQAIRGLEDDQWSRSNPEARARAADTVAQLEKSLADLRSQQARARDAGNERKAAEHAASIEARESWLTEARRALDEFSR